MAMMGGNDDVRVCGRDVYMVHQFLKFGRVSYSSRCEGVAIGSVDAADIVEGRIFTLLRDAYVHALQRALLPCRVLSSAKK